MTKELKQEIGQLLLMCLQANLLESHEVFFNFSGHVNMIDLSINEKGNTDYIFADTSYITGNLYNKDEFKVQMKRWRKQLMNILNPKIALTEA